MDMPSTPASNGLDGVVVADTRISDVDGARGRLVIAGADVEQIAGTIDFAEAVRRVLFAAGATIPHVDLGSARAAAFELLPRTGDALDATDGMDALRTALSHLRPTGDLARDALAAIGAAPVIVAAWHRKRSGLAPIPPDADRGHAADYLRMLGAAVDGEGEVDAARATALDTYLVTVIDHGMNASTFAARVVAATRSDLVSCAVAGVGALKGPLHGGAPGPVLDMLDAVGEPARAEAWLRAELAAGRRIMGMGHRVYRVRDPRAAVLERAIARLGVDSPRLALAQAIEAAATKILAERYPERPMGANVELNTAILLDAIGLPRTLFSPTFAVSRIAGWCAHVIEQRALDRIIRPASRYVGDAPP